MITDKLEAFQVNQTLGITGHSIQSSAAATVLVTWPVITIMDADLTLSHRSTDAATSVSIIWQR